MDSPAPQGAGRGGEGGGERGHILCFSSRQSGHKRSKLSSGALLPPSRGSDSLREPRWRERERERELEKEGERRKEGRRDVR